MKTATSLINFIGIVAVWSLYVAGQEAETDGIDYVPPVPRKEVQPVITAADGAGCCSVASEASHTQGEAEKERAKTLGKLVDTRESADAVRTKKAMAKLVTQQQAERLASKAVESKAKKDSDVAEVELQALENELAALRAADRKSEQDVAQLDEMLMKEKEAAVQQAHKLRESVEADLDLVKREVHEIQSALPRFRTQDAEAEREVQRAAAGMNSASPAAAAKEVEAPSHGETAKRQAEDAAAQAQKAEDGAQKTEKRFLISVRKSKRGHSKHAGKLTPGAEQ
uniref:Uncharacterized protein n=1 Tax=Neospora caninum (strain Liverpool) TaxID=572307 RepID=A0A0F7UJQ1_NEOCL|nr:TPA: hypothetical protein BN1204_058795 [Neospora caninum Liverpool]